MSNEYTMVLRLLSTFSVAFWKMFRTRIISGQSTATYISLER